MPKKLESKIMGELIQLKINDIPKLPRHAKLRYDEARKMDYKRSRKSF